MTPSNRVRHGTIEDPESMKNQRMIYRKVLLRIVFWALGLAACFGAVGVIFAGHDTLWRIVGTCAATAAGAFLVLAASLWVAKTLWRCNWRHRAACEGDSVARKVPPGLDHDLDVLGLWDWNRPSADRA